MTMGGVSASLREGVSMSNRAPSLSCSSSRIVISTVPFAVKASGSSATAIAVGQASVAVFSIIAVAGLVIVGLRRGNERVPPVEIVPTPPAATAVHQEHSNPDRLKQERVALDRYKAALEQEKAAIAQLKAGLADKGRLSEANQPIETRKAVQAVPADMAAVERQQTPFPGNTGLRGRWRSELSPKLTLEFIATRSIIARCDGQRPVLAEYELATGFMRILRKGVVINSYRVDFSDGERFVLHPEIADHDPEGFGGLEGPWSRAGRVSTSPSSKDEATGLIALRTLAPLNNGVEAWVEVDGTRAASWSSGEDMVTLTAKPGMHEIAVRSRWLGTLYCKRFAGVRVLPGATVELAVGTVEAEPTPTELRMRAATARVQPGGAPDLDGAEKWARAALARGQQAERDGRWMLARVTYYGAWSLYPETSVAAKAHAAMDRMDRLIEMIGRSEQPIALKRR